MSICPICQKEFKPKNKLQIYCSPECKAFNHDKKQSLKNCKFCWKEFYWTRRTSYCSDECRHEWRVLEQIKSNVKNTWYSNPSYNPETIKKRKQTRANKTPEEKAEREKKKQETSIKNRWTKYFLSSPEAHTEEFLQKASDTTYEKYWKRWNCLTEQCQTAGWWRSWAEQILYKFFEDNDIAYEEQYWVENVSFDARVWDILIDLDPYPHHNSTRWRKGPPKPSRYHKYKSSIGIRNWWRCIRIFDWDPRDKILNLIREDKKTIWARKCKIKQISYEEWNTFLEKYHLQNGTQKRNGDIYLGLFYKEKLVMVMSFWKPRWKTANKYQREILRLCTDGNYVIPWWANKLFKYFINLTNPSNVVSFCDMAKFTWTVYENMWFDFVWWSAWRRHWRFVPIWKRKKKEIEKEVWHPIILPEQKDWHIRDSYLQQCWGFDKLLWKYFWEYWWGNKNNEILMRKFNYVEIYDAGQATYVRHKEKEEK